MDFIRLDPAQFRIFLLVMIRVSVILFMIPFFGSRNWPLMAKVGLVLTLSFLLYPLARNQTWPALTGVFDFGLIVLGELMIGLCLAIIMHLILAGLQTGGQMIGFQMGFAVVNVVDPQTGTHQSVVAQMAYLTGVLLFLTLDGHHLFIDAIAESLTTIRPGAAILAPGVLELVVKVSVNMFVLAIKLVAPAMAALLFTHTAMGIVAKAVPQINILLMSFPLTISVGLFFFGLCLSLLGVFMGGFVERDLGPMLGQILRQLGGR